MKQIVWMAGMLALGCACAGAAGLGAEAPAPPEEVYTRRYAGYTDRLIPAGDYGPLLPYAGTVDEWWTGRTSYGLATLKGEIVTDPVYASVYSLHCWPDDTPMPMLVLSIRLEEEEARRWGELFAVAAADGSWCTEAEYISRTPLDARTLLLLRKDGQFFACGPDGALRPGMDAGPYLTEFAALEDVYWEFPHEALVISGNWLCIPVLRDGAPDWDHWRMFDAMTGEEFLPPEGVQLPLYGAWERDEYAAATWRAGEEEYRMGYLRQDGAWAIEPRFRYAEDFTGDHAVVSLAENHSGTAGDHPALIDRGGQVVLDCAGKNLQRLNAADGGACYVVQDDTGIVCYNDALEDVTPEWATPERAIQVDYTMLWYQAGGELLVFDGVDSHRIALPDEAEVNGLELQNGLLKVRRGEDDTAALYALDGRCVVPFGVYDSLYSQRDSATGVVYLTGESYKGGYVDILDAEGRFLGRSTGSVTAPDISHGLLHISDELSDGYRTLDGEWVFRVRTQTVWD